MTEGLYLQPINIMLKSICISTIAEFKTPQDNENKHVQFSYIFLQAPHKADIQFLSEAQYIVPPHFNTRCYHLLDKIP
jgi:hypothetical protein